MIKCADVLKIKAKSNAMLFVKHTCQQRGIKCCFENKGCATCADFIVDYTFKEDCSAPFIFGVFVERHNFQLKV